MTSLFFNKKTGCSNIIFKTATALQNVREWMNPSNSQLAFWILQLRLMMKAIQQSVNMVMWPVYSQKMCSHVATWMVQCYTQIIAIVLVQSVKRWSWWNKHHVHDKSSSSAITRYRIPGDREESYLTYINPWRINLFNRALKLQIVLHAITSKDNLFHKFIILYKNVTPSTLQTTEALHGSSIFLQLNDTCAIFITGTAAADQARCWMQSHRRLKLLWPLLQHLNAFVKRPFGVRIPITGRYYNRKKSAKIGPKGNQFMQVSNVF